MEQFLLSLILAIIPSIVSFVILYFTIQHNHKENKANLNYNRRLQEINNIKDKATAFIDVCETQTDFLLGRAGILLLGREDINKLQEDVRAFHEHSNYAYTDFYFALPITKDIDSTETKYIKFVIDTWEILGGLMSDTYRLLELYLNEKLEFHSVINGWLNDPLCRLHSKKLINALSNTSILEIDRSDKSFRNELFYLISQEQRHFYLAEKTKRYLDYEYSKIRQLYESESSMWGFGKK